MDIYIFFLPILEYINIWCFCSISLFYQLLKQGSCQLLFTQEGSELLTALLQASRIWRVHDVDQALRRINGMMQWPGNDMAWWYGKVTSWWDYLWIYRLQSMIIAYYRLVGIFSSAHVFSKIVETEKHLCPQSSCSNKGGLLPAHQCPIRSSALWCCDRKDASRKLATHGPSVSKSKMKTKKMEGMETYHQGKQAST